MNTLSKYRISALLLFALLLSFLFSSCSFSGNSDDSKYVSPYDFTQLRLENDRFVYGTEPQSRIGIDVSDHQGNINWNRVGGAGIEFAMIRVGNRGYTEGQIYLDTFFEENMSGAQNAELFVGAYFFSQALNEEEAREEARFVLEHLQGHEIDYPIAYDFEPVADAKGRANSLSADQRTKNARAFCAIIEEAGFEAIIYGNKSDINYYDKSLREDYDIWFAEYGTMIPSAKFDFTIWQYSNTGTVDGIETSVDMNIHFLES